MEDKTIEKIQRALIKRALGYDTSETVEEYALNGDDMTVVRKKVTTKNMPPDITAAKILLEKAGEENKNGYFEKGYCVVGGQKQEIRAARTTEIMTCGD